MKLVPQSPDRLEKLERTTEMPLMLLSFALMPVIAGLYLWDLTPTEERIYTAFEIAIWALFAIAFIVKLALAPSKLGYLRHNWHEALLVLVPVLRPLRILAAILFVVRDVSRWRHLVTFETLLAYGIGIVLLAATIVTNRGAERGRRKTFVPFPTPSTGRLLLSPPWATATITL